MGYLATDNIAFIIMIIIWCGMFYAEGKKNGVVVGSAATPTDAKIALELDCERGNDKFLRDHGHNDHKQPKRAPRRQR